jgi:hypothetical protein
MTEKRIKLSGKNQIMREFNLLDESEYQGFLKAMMAFLAMENLRHSKDIRNLKEDGEKLHKKYGVSYPPLFALEELFVEVD